MIKQAKRNFIDNIADVFTDDPEPGRSFIVDVLDSPVNNSDNVARLLASGAAYGATNNYLKTGKLFPSIFDKGKGKDKGGINVPDYITAAKSTSEINPIIKLEETSRLLDYMDTPEAGNLRKDLFDELVLFGNNKAGNHYKNDFIRYVNDNYGNRLNRNLKRDITRYLSSLGNQGATGNIPDRKDIIDRIYRSISSSTGNGTGKMTVDALPDDVLKHFYDDLSDYAKGRISGKRQLKEHFKHFQYNPLEGPYQQIDDIIHYLHDFGRDKGLDEASEIGRNSKTSIGKIIDNIKHNIKGLKRKPIYLTDAQKLSMLTNSKFNKFAPNRSIYALNRLGKYGLIGSATLPMIFGAYKHFRDN